MPTVTVLFLMLIMKLEIAAYKGFADVDTDAKDFVQKLI